MKVIAGWIWLATALIVSAGYGQDRDFAPPDFGLDRPASRNIPRAGNRSRAIPTTLNRGASINPQLLNQVVDNTIGLSIEEKELFFSALRLAEATRLESLEQWAADFREDRRLADPQFSKRAASEFQTYVDLVRHPDSYRGRPVSLRGRLRRLTRQHSETASPGDKGYYEGWVFTDDSQGNPAVVIFANKPIELPVGGDLNEEVRVTGYFVKMYGYEAEDGLRAAPLLLAGEMEWRPVAAAKSIELLTIESYLLVGLIVALVGIGLWQVNRREMASPARQVPEIDFSRFPPQEYSATLGPRVVEADDA